MPHMIVVKHRQDGVRGALAVCIIRKRSIQWWSSFWTFRYRGTSGTRYVEDKDWNSIGFSLRVRLWRMGHSFYGKCSAFHSIRSCLFVMVAADADSRGFAFYVGICGNLGCSNSMDLPQQRKHASLECAVSSYFLRSIKIAHVENVQH